MKMLLLLLTIGFSTELVGQQLTGTINFKEPINFVWMTARNLDRPDGTNNMSVRCDSSRQLINLRVNPNELYQIQISGLYEIDSVFYIKLAKDSVVRININYPPKICPYSKSTGRCPVTSHVDNVIPIVYGLLMGSEISEKLEKEEIRMGGCEVTDCDPNWYCKKHGIEF